MTTTPSSNSSKVKIESGIRLTDPRAYADKPSPLGDSAGTEIPVGVGPITIVFSVEGDRAFVLNGGESSVTVIDVKSATPIKTIEVGPSPRGGSASPNGRDIVVAHGGTTSLIDCDTLEVRVIEGASTTVNAPFSPDGKYIYFCASGDPEISVVDVETLEISSVTLEGHPDAYSIVLNPVRSLAYVGDSDAGEVMVLDTKEWTLIKRVKVAQVVAGLAISGDGKLLAACDVGGNKVAFVDLETNTVISTVGVGDSPVAAVFSPAGDRVYIAEPGDSTVSVIDTEIFERTEVFPVGRGPFDVAINPEGARVYVANVSSDSVSVLNVGPSEIVEDFESVEPTQIGGVGETMLTDIFKVTLLEVSDPEQYLAISNADWGGEWVSGNALYNYDAYTDKMMTYSLELIDGTASSIKFWVANGNNTSLIPYLDVWFMRGLDGVIDAQHFSWPQDTAFEMQVDSGLLQGIQTVKIRANGQYFIDQIAFVRE
ncbi:YncE family protein [Pseudomonas fluorescens]|uniref:YNCE-like beta-propeller domain-containing protein n=1 Tax=Pseudomonas fluorescens TaxID=294 RepID=A0A5E7IX72_PSEFL|nr:hypothetical protein [Pseudomonas fluorescens]VVO80324.1 hypothetical protein PS880_01766 [Pseudomonas fluorescens]